MSLSSRLGNGWNLGMTSLRTIKENPKLLAFPLLSGAALVAVCLTFLGGFAFFFGFDFDQWVDQAFGEYLGYAVLFGFYLVCYFVIVFFNVGLVFCAKRIFEGEEVRFREGLEFAGSRVVTIINWAVLAATVGVVLKILEERLGWIGHIISGIVGIVWSIATFFVIPIIAYEDVSPIEAVKRSGKMMRAKWGEALGANFGFGLLFVVGYVIIAATAVFLGIFIHPIAGVFAGILLALLLHTALSAAEMVFVAATYQHLNDQPAGNFEGEILSSAFVPKKK